VAEGSISGHTIETFHITLGIDMGDFIRIPQDCVQMFEWFSSLMVRNTHAVKRADC